MKKFTTAPLPDVRLTEPVCRILEQLDAAVCRPEDAVSLPVECYTSEEWFKFEQRAVWDREWICLGHQGSIPRPGDYFSIEINDDPYLVVRGDDGEIRVLSAVCQHRGHLLGEASGNVRLFVCPYHAWSYDLEGRLVNAPGMERHASVEELRANHCLPRMRVETWNGFVFINLDGRSAPLHERLCRLEAEFRNYHMDGLLATPPVDYPGNPWNWKWMQENGMEPYHVTSAHKGYHEIAPVELTTFPAWDEEMDGAMWVSMGLTHEDASFNETGKCLFPVIPTLTGRDRRRFMISVVPPNVLIATLSDMVFYFLIMPHGANSMTLRVGFLFPPDTLELNDFQQRFDRMLEGFNIINSQDINANISVQRGRHSRFANRGRMAPLETPIDHFNRWLVKRYRIYADDLKLRAAG